MLVIVCATRSLLADCGRRWIVDESCWDFENSLRWMTTDKAGAGWLRVNAAAIRKKGAGYLHVIKTRDWTPFSRQETMEDPKMA
jgi:hypothetical protein